MLTLQHAVLCRLLTGVGIRHNLRLCTVCTSLARRGFDTTCLRLSKHALSAKRVHCMPGPHACSRPGQWRRCAEVAQLAPFYWYESSYSSPLPCRLFQ